MKKYLYQFMVALMAITSFALVACSDDDDEVSSSDDIVGTWKWDSFGTDTTEDFFGEQYIQFNANGQYIEVGIDGYGSEGEVDIMRGQWKRSGNTITISGNGIPSTTTEISELTDTKLTLITLGVPMSYKRVDDSEIEQYLN